MEKATKNTHLNHMEDNIFLGHIEGTREAVHFIRSFRDLLQGQSQRALQTSVKWDGAPAIWVGPHPENKKFIVAKKSLFNKVPLYYSSEAQIKKSKDLSPELKQKFLIAFNSYKNADLSKLIQGDFLFDDKDIQITKVDGQRYVTFHPNTIAYSVPVGTELAKEIQKAKMGIVFHTTYTGNSIESLTASAGVKLGKAPKGVWQIDADLPDMSGTASLTKAETNQIDKELTNIGTHFRYISRDTFTKLNDPYIAAFCTTYTNAFIRNNVTPTAEEAAAGLPEFIMAKFKKEIDKRKTAAGKAKQQELMKEAISPIMSVPKNELVSVFHLYYSLQKAKKLIIKKLSSAGFIKTFLKTADGWKVTGQEGFVATDKISRNSVKLVDRLEFSYANFSDDVIKGWQSDFRR